MKYDIIGKFPISQLNDILGGIKSNSEYYFAFNIEPFNEKGVCEDILRKLNKKIVSSDESGMIFYKYMWMILSENFKGNDNILLINGHEEKIKVREYFNANGLDYNEFCRKYDHNEVQEFYKNYIFKEDITNIVYESGKCVIDFDFIDDTLPERYCYSSMPYDYELYSVRVMFSGNLFDRIVVNREAEKTKYEYPFKEFSGNGDVFLMRDIFIEIDKYITDDYYQDEGLVTLGKLKLSYDIEAYNIIK